MNLQNVVLINNSGPNGSMGTYASCLYVALRSLMGEHIELFSRRNLHYDGPGGILKIVNHLLFLHSIPRHFDLYHFTNPNFASAASRLGPFVVTVLDVMPLLSQLNRERIIRSIGIDLPMLVAMKFNFGFIRYAKRIICISRYTDHALRSNSRLADSRTRVIYLGVDHALFRTRDQMVCRSVLGLPKSSKMILNVAVDEPRKNIGTLLKSFREVKKKFPNSFLVRIGDETIRTKRLISRLGLANKVLYRRPPARELALFYSAADVFVSPSLYEGFGLPILESMASGCPVVTSNVTSLPEVVGDAGILVPPMDVRKIAEETSRVLSDEKLQAELVIQGLSRSRLFTWERCAQETARVYEEASDS